MSSEERSPWSVDLGGREASLARDEMRRYARHLVLPEVGPEGQRRLKAARVLCIGTGGLGSPISLYLAAAGVGHLTLTDFDTVDETNLQRQVLFSAADVGRPKVETARERLLALNPHIRVEVVRERFSAANALELAGAHDVVVDGTDNFAARYLSNDACALAGKPNVYGSIFRFEGQVSVFHARAGGPCYRCLFPEPPPPELAPSCSQAGVLGVLPGVIGCLQATECLKLILGKGRPLIGRLLLFDALEMSFHELQLQRNPGCPLCGDAPTIRELSEYGQVCADAPAAIPEIEPAALKARLDAGEPLVLLDVREESEWEICRIAGARLIPLGQVAERAGELDPGEEIVAYCHHGMRSARAARILAEKGFRRVLNLAGGIEAWAEAVEPGMERY